MRAVRFRRCTKFSLSSAALFALLLFGSVASGQTSGSGDSRAVASLTLHKPVERVVNSGQVETFTFDAHAGDFVHLVVEQKGVDVVVTIRDPHGHDEVVMDSPNRDFGPEPVSWVAAESGACEVNIVAKADRKITGAYRLELLKAAPPTNEDRLRLQTEEIFRRAVMDDRSATKESALRTIAEYEAANEGWTKLHDDYEEALGLHRIGLLYSLYGDAKKALDHYDRALKIRRNIVDRAGTGNTLNNLSLVYANLGDKQKALEYLNQANQAYQAVNDRSGEAMVLGNLANRYSTEGDAKHAEDLYQESATGYRAIGDQTGESAMLVQLGVVAYRNGERPLALASFNSALPIFRALHNRSSEAETLNNIGTIEAELKDTTTALQHHQAALSIYRSTGDRIDEAHTLNHIATVYNGAGDKQKALEYFNEALPIYHALGEAGAEGETLFYRGVTYIGLNEPRKAIDSYNQALVLVRAAHNRVAEASTLMNLGAAYSGLEERQKALDFYNQALPIQRSLADHVDEAGTLSSIALIQEQLGQKQDAIALREQALVAYRALGDSVNEGNTLVVLADRIDDLGDSRKSLELYTEALTVKRRLGDRRGEAGVLVDMGVAYDKLNEHEQELSVDQQALLIQRNVGDRAGEIRTLNNIGSQYFKSGDKKKALDYFNQALPYVKTAGDQHGEARTLSNIAMTYNELGQKQKAVEFYQLDLPVEQALGNRSAEADVLVELGTLYAGGGDNRRASNAFADALSIRRTLGDQVGEVEATRGLNRAEAKLGEARRALELFWIRVVCFMVGCVALYVAAFMYETEQGKWQNRLEELWIKISDRASLIDSKTIALFNVVAATDTAILNRFYGKKLFSFRMVGLSTITSLAAAFLFAVLLDVILPRRINPSPLPVSITRILLLAAAGLILLALPALKTTSRAAVALTLLPIVFFISFWILSRLTHDTRDHWSAEVNAACLISAFSDVAVTTLIRKSITVIGRQVRIWMILLMLCLQILCIAVFTVLPAFLAAVATHPHTDIRVTLFLVAAMNITTVLLSIGFIVSLTLVIVHRFSWPVLERVLYPIAEFRVMKNRKLMGGVAALCLVYALNLTSGLLKGIVETVAK
jgi:tetratricopeptide (TPR) repeat protein